MAERPVAGCLADLIHRAAIYVLLLQCNIRRFDGFFRGQIATNLIANFPCQTWAGAEFNQQNWLDSLLMVLEKPLDW